MNKGVNDILTNATAIERLFIASFAMSTSKPTRRLWKMKQAFALWDPGPQLPGDNTAEEDIFLLLC